MSIHDRFQDLAAAAIDFELDPTERAELDEHLVGCDECRRTAARYREDASAITAAAKPRLAPGRSALILADALRLRKPRSPLRLLAVAALLAVLGGGAVVGYMGLSRLLEGPVIAVVPSPSAPATATSSGAASAQPSSSVDPPVPSPSATPRSSEPTTPGSLPVHAVARQVGTQVEMVPATGGGLFVSIPDGLNTVLTLLDASGAPRAGWPISITGASVCELLDPAEDGSIRLICTMDDLEGNLFAPVAAFAFDQAGRSVPGWPVVLGDHGADGYVTARVVGDQLALLAWVSLGDVLPEGERSRDDWIMVISADGTVRSGTKVWLGNDCCDPGLWAMTAGGVAYGIVHRSDGDPQGPRMMSELRGLAIDGHPFWAGGTGVLIPGIASRPAFDDAGRIRMTVVKEPTGQARTVAYTSDGGVVVDGPIEPAFTASGWCDGIEGGGCDGPAPPLVGADGTTFIAGREAVDAVAAALAWDRLDMKEGWPYRAGRSHQPLGTCLGNDTCASLVLAAPALGPGNVLYMILRADKPSAGGSIVAVDPDGRVVRGWPVNLSRAGSAFWAVVVGPDGMAYVLAVEPEANDGSSATILAIDPASTVRYTKTIIDP